MRRRRIAFVAAALLVAASGSTAVPAGNVARAESRLVGRIVPDIPLRLTDGRAARMSDLAGGRPLMLALFYRRCTGVCVPLLAQLRDAVAEIGGAGLDYRVLALSFDEADTVADVRAHAAALGLQRAPGWSFAVAAPGDVARVTGALDFSYSFDPVTQQSDHPALVAVVDRGRVIRALLDSRGGGARYRTLVQELRGRFVSVYRVPDQTPLQCIVFDPRTGETRFAWGAMLLVLPAIAALAAVLVMFVAPARARPRA